MSTTYTISMLQDASPGSTDAAVKTIDVSLTQIQTALNDLSGRVDNLNTKSSVIRQHVPLGAGVLVGDLVYYNAHLDQPLESRRGEYEKAQALTLAETTAGGLTIEAPCARVEGMVIAIDSGSSPLTGTLLVGGYWEDTDATANCLGSTASPGVYYLSPVNAGGATLTTNGHLRQPVLSYYGNGAFSLSLFYLAHDNHYHSSQVLPGAWTPVSGVTIGGQVAQYQYSGDTAVGLGTLGDTTALFYDGKLENTTGTSAFKIYDGKIYYMTTPAPTGVVTVFNHYPFAYESAIVRSVYSTSDAITVKNTNGQIAITGNDFIQGVTAKSAQAIYSINGRELNYTPVVTDVIAGPGIEVSRALDGTAIVSADNTLGGLMDAYSINHNGTTLISDAGVPPLQYITFPAGNRESNFVMYLPIRDIGNAVCDVAVWGIKLGTENASLDVSAKFIPDPTSTTQSTTSGVVNSQSLTIPGGDDAAALTYSEVDITGCTVTGSGMLVAVVGATNATNQIQLLRAGFKLKVNAGATDTTTTDEMGTAITQTMTVATGETILAGDAVMISNGLLLKCTNYKNSLADNTNKCVGVAMTNATEGQQLTYMITGTMTLAISNAEPGDSLYIQPSGTLAAVADVDTFMASARYLQKVGTMLTGNKIQVNVESAVRG